ncbi:VWA domain-containing protein [Acidobacterium sp. S8]|uniref:VWA domain-containing protein n=1 Tax=Acidobacterium sp. S8 TaxID=1641854 RepID=UPI001C20219D|nr:VWA domain-containing protein [Acidobacterium sp. S8]
MNMLSAIATPVLSMILLAVATASAQSLAGMEIPAITVRSNLVMVPALVKTKAGEIVFSLNADDFVLTDDGVPQSLQLESDTDSQPLALAVIVQTGGQGASHLHDYRDLEAVLDAIIGNVPHRVAVVSFDSMPHLEQDFIADTDAAAKTITNLHEGDPGAAILDALNFGINLLSKQPPAYRRAVVLFSETIDIGSQTSFENAIRAVDDTNTSIYSFGFSSTKSALKHQTSELPRPGGSPYSDEPYSPGGCMSHDPDADPDAHGKRSVQALDCASDLLPPLRLARMMYIAAKDGLARNVPESVAQLTGGEYFTFKDANTLNRHLVAISHDVPNYYVLSFRPQLPHSGFHALKLSLKDRPELLLRARNAYWVEAETANNK